MTERNLCLTKYNGHSFPHLFSDEIIFEIKEDGIQFLFSYPSITGVGYTQERYHYQNNSGTMNILPGGNVAIAGTPDITIDNIPLVIAPEKAPHIAVSMQHITIVVKMSEQAIRAAAKVFQRNGEVNVC